MAHHVTVVAQVVFVNVIYLLIHRIVLLTVGDFAGFLPVHRGVLVDEGVGSAHLTTNTNISLRLLVLALHHAHSSGASTTAVNAGYLITHTASRSLCTPRVLYARSTANLVLLGLVGIAAWRNIKHIIPHIRSGAEALSPMLGRFYDHDVLQTELLVDYESLLGVVIDAVDCDIEAVDIEQEVGLDDAVDHY